MAAGRAPCRWCAKQSGGRAKGTPNKKTQLKRLAADVAAGTSAPNITARDFLTAVMQTATADPRYRLDAAKALFSEEKKTKPGDEARLIEVRSAWSALDEARLQELREQRDLLHQQHLASARAGQSFDPHEGDRLGKEIFELERRRPYSKAEVEAMNLERTELGLGDARVATDDGSIFYLNLEGLKP
jgi:hypothetical protein